MELFQREKKSKENKGFDFISVCQINLNKSKAATTELSLSMSDVALIQEPYVSRGKVRLLESTAGHILASNNNPRAAIYVRKRLQPWLVENFTDRDICVCTLDIDGEPWYLASVYLDILLDIKQNAKLSDLIDFCRTKKIPLVLGLDTNAHSYLWESSDTNGRGEDLEEIIFEKDLTVLNRGNVCTFQTERARSIIDVTLVNAYAAQHCSFEDWEVTDKATFSDHRRIEFSLGASPEEVREARNFKKANWARFKQALADCEWGFLGGQSQESNFPVTEDTLNETYVCFEGAIRTALDKACPLRQVKPKGLHPWWSDALTQMRVELRYLERKQKNSSLDRWRFVEARMEYKKAILAAKRDSWKDFCTRAEGAKSISKLVHILEGDKIRRVSLLNKEGNPTTTPGESLDVLLETHFPNHKRAEVNLLEASQVIDCPREVEEYITAQRVRLALDSFGPYKAAGPDGFPPCVLKNLTGEAIEHLAKIYRYSIKTGWLPESWRRMKVVFIPKQGKSSYADAKAYRPITLSNFLLKCMERIIQWFLLEKVIQMPLVSQHAYTRGLSCETALSTVVDMAERMIHQGKYLLMVSLDCSGAFDCIRFSSARKALENHGVPGAIVTWYENILRARQVSADLQGTKKTITPTQGSPQGGILSPLVWNLVMDSLLTQFSGGAVKVVGYADDILLMIGGKVPSVMGQLMQKALDKVLTWGNEHGLSFNPSKTQTVMFNRARKNKIFEPPLRLGDSALVYSEDLNYLGVLINKRLSWTKHIEERYRKCIRLLQKVKTIVSADWGLTPERLRWIYTAIVRPKLTYGCIVWGSELGKQQTRRLERIQRLILRLMCSPLRSTGTASLEVIMDMIPLDLFVGEVAAKARLRTRNKVPKTWDGCGDRSKIRRALGHQRIWDDHLERCGLEGRLGAEPTTFNWLENRSVKEAGFDIFTDGSKIDGKVGFGFAATQNGYVVHEESGHLNDEATVFQAELVAIQSALLWLISNPPKLKGEEGIIHSDSQAAIGAIFSPLAHLDLVRNIHLLLGQVGAERSLEIRWVKGHSDVTGNELADYLAKEGALYDEGQTREVPKSLESLKKQVHDYWANVWQQRWSALSSCKITKWFLPDVNHSGKNTVKKLSKRELNVVVQATSGHGLFRSHLGKWVEDIDVTCPLCLEGEEEPLHLWSDCPALSYERWEKARKSKEGEVILPILKFFSSGRINRLMKKNAQLLEARRAGQLSRTY